MALTTDPEKIEVFFKAFFDDIFADSSLQKGFASLNKVIEIVYSKPDLSFVIDCRNNSAKFIPGADGQLKPDVTILMDWETAHKFWMGKLDAISALFDQRIKIKGDAGALLDLKPLFKQTSAIYKDVATRLSID